MNKRGLYLKTNSVIVLAMLLIIPLTEGLVITPQTTTIEEYDSSQEVVVTFYNDQFEPVGYQPTPAYLSSYLNEYIRVEPNKFLIEPGEQENVRIIMSFPTTLTPQLHNLILQAYPGSKENFSITFRPEGEQQVGLLLQEFHSNEEEYGSAVTMTMNMKNVGNTVLFVTPQVFIKQQGIIVKNTTYPRPIIIQPNEVYPLTLRQDNSNLAPGEYVALVQALYKADAGTRITDEEVFVFTVVEQRKEEEMSNWWIILAIIGSIAILTGGIIWLVPAITKQQHRRAQSKKKKEKHITKSNTELTTAWHEVYVLRKELASISEDVRSFVEESEQWLRQQQ